MLHALTLVAVADTKVSETISSLRKSSKSINFKEIILLTSKNIERGEIFEGLKILKINPLRSAKNYNHFIIYELFKYINTSHLLLIQWDGFILNPNKWNQSFLDYDYIGAPFIPRANDINYSRDKQGNFFSIGNGGFTLRSRKLLEAPTKFNLKDNFKYTNHHEDGFFCVYHRSFLESKGFKWAPFNLAKNFSFESIISINDIIDLPLGFHGRKILKINKLILLVNYVYNLMIRLMKKMKLLNS